VKGVRPHLLARCLAMLAFSGHLLFFMTHLEKPNLVLLVLADDKIAKDSRPSPKNASKNCVF